MYQPKVKTYERQDAALMKITLGFLFSPLILIVAFASVISF